MNVIYKYEASFEEMKRRSIRSFFIPDYILNTLNSRGMSLTALEKLMVELKIKQLEPEIFQALKDKLSGHDTNMLKAANGLNNIFGLDAYVRYIEAGSIPQIGQLRNEFVELTQIYTNPKVDTSSIIMSKIDEGVELPWRFHALDQNIVMIVLQDSFCNFLTYGIDDFKVYFLETLTNFMAKMYGIDMVNTAFNTSTLIDFYYKSCRH